MRAKTGCIVLITILISLGGGTSSSLAQVPTEQQMLDMLAHLPRGHRVIWGDGDESRVHKAIEKSPDLQFVWQSIHRDADAALDAPVLKRELIGRRLLAQSRLAMSRLMQLGMAYRLTGDAKYANRAGVEMENLARFSDWNPSHFLDPSEMTAGMAIGLDWCRDGLSAGQIVDIQKAIIEKGIKPSLNDPSWAHGTNNWNQVCNDSMLLGALAIADVEPKLAAKIIVRSINGLPYVLRNYAPDGAYPEGPGYWSYGTTYSVIGLSAMKLAFGSDFGLSDTPGFRKTPEYFIHIAGPTGRWFCYSDVGRSTGASIQPAQFYLADLAHDQTLAYTQWTWLDQLRRNGYGSRPRGDSSRLWPLILLWADPDTSNPPPPAKLSYVADGITPVACFRTSWRADASYVAIKGGSASTSHAHMDAGAFCIDALGQRWVDSLGSQDYNSLEQQKVDLWNLRQQSQRWSVFRLGPMSQNILTVNDQLQDVSGRAVIARADARRAMVDLTPVYAGQLDHATREVCLDPGGSITLRDSIVAGASLASVRFAFVTSAEIKLLPDGAQLSLAGKHLQVKVSGVDGLKMEIDSTHGPQPYDEPNPGTRMLAFKVMLAPKESANWTVAFIPEGMPAPTDGTN